MFLIYPYWNINQGMKNMYTTEEAVSNLSILEYKSISRTLSSNKLFCF